MKKITIITLFSTLLLAGSLGTEVFASDEYVGDSTEEITPVDPSNPGTGEVDPTDPGTTDPVDPTDPTDPGDGGGTVDPTDPGDGGGTIDPTDPTDPGDGGGTTNPTDPGDGGGTTDPTDPTDPGDGGGTTNPTDPGDGGGTTNPTDPGDGGGTTNPTNPGDGGGTTNPTNPGGGGTTNPGTTTPIKPVDTNPAVENPVNTQSGHVVVAMEDSQAIVQMADGTTKKISAKEIGAEVQADGSVQLKDKDGKVKVLPKTGEEGNVLLSLAGGTLTLASGWFWVKRRFIL